MNSAKRIQVAEAHRQLHERAIVAIRSQYCRTVSELREIVSGSLDVEPHFSSTQMGAQAFADFPDWERIDWPMDARSRLLLRLLPQSLYRIPTERTSYSQSRSIAMPFLVGLDQPEGSNQR